MEALEKIGEPAVEPLIQALGNPEEGVRWEAAKALGMICDPRAVKSLIQALRDPNREGRWLAAGAREKIGQPAVESLIQALGDPDEEVRQEAAQVLGEISDSRALPELAQIAREDMGKTPWGSVAEAATKAVEKIKEATRVLS